jgi:hypothetical protein
MTIPKRIIQTGKNRALPLLARVSEANLRSLNPEFEHVFFDDEGVQKFIDKEFPQYRAIFDGFPYRIQRYDFFRYLAVYRLGGFYFDLDVFLARDLNPLLNSNCVFPFEELTMSRFLRTQHDWDWEIGNYAFGAVPGHPFLRAVIENCVRAQKEPEWVLPMLAGIPSLFRADFTVLNTTGPGLITRTLAEHPELMANVAVLFPDNICDEDQWHQFGDFGVHLMNGSWRERGGFLRRRLALMWESWVRRPMMDASRRRGPARVYPIGSQS